MILILNPDVEQHAIQHAKTPVNHVAIEPALTLAQFVALTVTAADLGQRLVLQQRRLRGQPQQRNASSSCSTRLFPHHEYLADPLLEPLIRWLTAEGVTCSRAAAAGVITTEESDTLGLTVDVVDGIEFDHGYASAYMVANPERMEAVLDNPLILLTNKKITAVHVIGRGRGIRPGSSFASGSASLG